MYIKGHINRICGKDAQISALVISGAQLGSSPALRQKERCFQTGCVYLGYHSLRDYLVHVQVE